MTFRCPRAKQLRATIGAGLLGSIALMTACGGDGAVDPPVELPNPGFNFIVLEEFDQYVATMQGTGANVQAVAQEFGAIVRDFANGFTTTYWTAEFTRLLSTRVVSMKAEAVDLRPTHPDLNRIHREQYETGLDAYEDAFTLFLRRVETPGSISTAQLNEALAEGDGHLSPMEVRLSSLAGRTISLFPSSGGGIVGPVEGLSDF